MLSSISLFQFATYCFYSRSELQFHWMKFYFWVKSRANIKDCFIVEERQVTVWTTMWSFHNIFWHFRPIFEFFEEWKKHPYLVTIFTTNQNKFSRIFPIKLSMIKTVRSDQYQRIICQIEAKTSIYILYFGKFVKIWCYDAQTPSIFTLF